MDVTESEATYSNESAHSGCAHDDDSAEHTGEVSAAPRKLPKWAIALAVISFIIFNAFFLVFAMQMGSSSPEEGDPSSTTTAPASSTAP